jgi:hypothetical protein
MRADASMRRLLQLMSTGTMRGAAEPEPFPLAIDPDATATELIEAFVAESEHWATGPLLKPPAAGQMQAGKAILARDAELQRAVLFEALEQAVVTPVGVGTMERPYALVDCAALVLPRDLFLDEMDIQRILQLLLRLAGGVAFGGVLFPLLLARLERGCGGPPSADTADLIRRELEAVRHFATGPEYQRLSTRVTELLTPAAAGLPEGGEPWVSAMLTAVGTSNEDSRPGWQRLLAHAMRAEPSKPTKKWASEAAGYVDGIGRDRFRAQALGWFADLTKPAQRALSPHNAQLVKGLVWACADFDDSELARALGHLAEAMLTWIPYFPVMDWRGLKAGNAALYALSVMPGDEPVAQLSRLSRRLKGKQLQDSIGKALTAASERRGMSRADLEELTVPSAVGEDEAAAADAPMSAEARQTVAAQRARLESLFLMERSWLLEDWQARYRRQPLLAPMVARLIWSFESGTGLSGLAMPIDGCIVGADGEAFEPEPASTRVRLWHPIDSDAETVARWRGFLAQRQIVQPFKQAHRELYRLPKLGDHDATQWRGFSGHIVRQGQFKALCDERGWRYHVQGRWVRGDGRATRELEAWDLRVELSVEPSGRDDENGAARMLYDFLTTGAVRFQYQDGTPCPLQQVPAIALSEILRDVDLFVGVCSIGTDAGWARRGGQTAFGDYWRDYAFGELKVAAQIRREVLEELLPGLSFAPRCTLDGRFLVVNGDRRTYRIHIGSGNVLMSPNDTLLVFPSPKRSQPGEPQVLMPFEGDTMLAQILSRATVLAGDGEIADAALRRQISRR